MIKIVCPIPVLGRHPLLSRTISRLKNQKSCEVIVVCAGGMDDKAICEASGAEFIIHDNKPLGAKWQSAVFACRKYAPDAMLYLGSSDLNL